jgi:uncharacterized protein YceK
MTSYSFTALFRHLRALSRPRTLVALLLFLLFGTGCGTLMRNDVKREHPMLPQASLYPATTIDLFTSRAFPIGLLFLLDLPVSLMTDTVLLPYDLWVMRKSRTDYRYAGPRQSDLYKEAVLTEIARRRQHAVQWLGERSSAWRDLSSADGRSRPTEFVPVQDFLAPLERKKGATPPYGWKDNRRFASYSSVREFIEKLQEVGAQQIYATRFDTPASDAFLIGVPETSSEKLQEILDSERAHYELSSARTDDGRWVLIWWGLQHRERPNWAFF